MVVPVQPVEGIEGDYITQSGDIVQGLSRDDKADVYCSGIQVVNPVKVRYLTSSTEDFGALWQQLIPLGQVRTSRVYEQQWYSVDTMEQLANSDPSLMDEEGPVQAPPWPA